MKKKILPAMILSTLLSISYVVLLFFPYFYVINSSTGVTERVILGYQIGFGNIGQPNVSVIGSGLIAVLMILGSLASLASFIALILQIIFKKTSPVACLFFGIATLGHVSAIASFALAWQAYSNLNEKGNTIPFFEFSFYLSLIFVVIALVINFSFLIRVAISPKQIRD